MRIAAVKNKPMSDATRYQVAVFYPEGWEPYGGIETFATESEAMAARDQTLALGFKHVHVWSVTTKMIQT